MMWNFKKQKLKEILFLQDFGQNPSKYAFLGVKGHMGIDTNWGYLDPVYSFTDGEVIFVSDFGDVVITDNKLEYTYSHLLNISVKVGDKIKTGDLIGVQDSMGKSVQPDNWMHLHFGIRELGNETPKIWNFGRQIKNSDNGFDGFIDPNLYCEKVIIRVAEAIERFENMNKNFPQHFNPGALRWSKYQSGSERGFAVFPDYETGWKALLFQLTIAADGRSRHYKPSMKVLDFCKTYAPASDNNNPQNYANFINNLCGFRGNEPISDWLLTEIEWLRKYNSVAKGAWWLSALIKSFNYIWGLIFRKK